MTATPNYPASAGDWSTQRTELIQLAVRGGSDGREAITLLARELTARWWVSVWNANPAISPDPSLPSVSPHFAFKHISVRPGADPTASWAAFDGDSRRVAFLYGNHSAPGSMTYRGVYVRRMDDDPIEPAEPRDAAIWSAVLADVSAEAAELL